MKMIMIKKTEDDEKVYVYHLNGTPLRIRTETITGLSRFPLPVGIEEHINVSWRKLHPINYWTDSSGPLFKEFGFLPISLHGHGSALSFRLLLGIE